ncbi:transposable element Tcb1 transposase [Trichonephila clavipes]|uniref:Transposable element Tcb1 transposase n=1 Tax=Trichonephila clavipes TaxID=2585209 RepID=A0A8X6S5F7_TRICX|nr:transposable element Tcb1 transposase [Trichonephila clavipes]
MHRHTGPAPGIMVWGGIGYHSRTSLVRIAGTLNSQRYISEVLEPVVLPYLQSLATAIFQQDNADEAHFWLNGYVNKQNCRIWSEANPQVYVETPLHPEKLTVWCALWAGGILLQKR